MHLYIAFNSLVCTCAARTRTRELLNWILDISNFYQCVILKADVRYVTNKMVLE